MEEIGNNLKNNLKTRTLICEQVTLPIINPPNHNIVTYNFHSIPYFTDMHLSYFILVNIDLTLCDVT